MFGLLSLEYLCYSLFFFFHLAKLTIYHFNYLIFRLMSSSLLFCFPFIEYLLVNFDLQKFDSFLTVFYHQTISMLRYNYQLLFLSSYMHLGLISDYIIFTPFTFLFIHLLYLILLKAYLFYFDILFIIFLFYLEIEAFKFSKENHLLTL
jgi:hypothetical protein